LANQRKGRRKAEGEKRNPSAATSSQIKGFYGFEVRGKICSSIGFNIFFWGCKGIEYECCYDCDENFDKVN